MPASGAPLLSSPLFSRLPSSGGVAVQVVGGTSTASSPAIALRLTDGRCSLLLPGDMTARDLAHLENSPSIVSDAILFPSSAAAAHAAPGLVAAAQASLVLAPETKHGSLVASGTTTSGGARLLAIPVDAQAGLVCGPNGWRTTEGTIGP